MEFNPRCFLSTFMLVYCACDMCTWCAAMTSSADDVIDHHVGVDDTHSTRSKVTRGGNAGLVRAARGAGTFTRRHELQDRYLVDNSTVTSLNMSLTHEGHAVIVTWEFESNDSRITGFVVCYRMSEREDYDSSKLAFRVRRFTLHSLHEDEEYEICVHAMVNATVVKEACHSWTQASRKMIVGIAVGCLFLFPLVAVIVWFYLKDQQIRKEYADLYGEKDELTFHQKMIKYKPSEAKKVDQLSNGCVGPKVDCNNHRQQTNFQGQSTDNKSHKNSEASIIMTNKKVNSKKGSDENIDV